MCYNEQRIRHEGRLLNRRNNLITRVKNKLFTNKDTLGYYAGLTFDAFDVTPDGKETMQTLSPRIHFFDEGTGQPVLMLHGALQSLYTFRENKDYLAQNFRVITPDLLGHGYSECPDMDYTIADHSASLRSFIETLDLSSFSVVAFGISCAYALHLASYLTEHVTRLVLINPGSFLNTDFPGAKTMRSGLGSHNMSKYAKESFMAKCLDRAYFDKTLIDPHSAEEYARPFANPDIRFCSRQSIINYDNEDFIPRLRKIDCSVLVISSKDDTVADHEEQEFIISHLNDVYTFELRNCGYLPHEEKSAKVNAALDEFLT